MTAVVSFCALCLLLVSGKAIRTAIPFLRKLYLPSSIVGGAIGMISSAVIKPTDMITIFGMTLPTNFVWVTVSFVVKALGSTPAMYLSLALLADILDHQEALHGKRTDGFSMMIYGAIMAGMTGLTTGVLNAVISATGYDVNALNTNTKITHSCLC